MVHQLLFDQMSEGTDVAVAALVQQLTLIGADWRVKQALKIKHLFGQWTCLKSFAMLYELTGSSEPWLYNEYGKPYWQDGPQFNISHCKEGLLVAVCDGPIGVDIETIRSANEGLIERTMNSKEQALIREADDPNRAFIRLWTQKEAYLKYKGTGIVEDLKQVLEGVDPTLCQTIEKENYIYTIVC